MSKARKPAAGSLTKTGGFWSVLPAMGPLAVAATGYAAWKVQWIELAVKFFTGPGRLSRILMLLFAIFNWKNMPFAWTMRVFYPIYHHHFMRRAPKLGVRALFAPIITSSRASLLDIDYNIHKSNSTYFADMDVNRTHLVSYICGPGVRAVSDNAANQLVLDPTTGEPSTGSFGIMLGSVHCSFHKEILPYRGYEMWSRVLAWDRKWMYMVTHFVPKGLGRPSEWLDSRFGRRNRNAGKGLVEGWEKKIHATAVSKYVFKLGRLTIHPAIILNASGLLPERPGGWAVDDDVAGVTEDLPKVDLFAQATMNSESDWREVEQRRRAGMEFAAKFHAMDQLQKMFDGGQGPVIGDFFPG